MKRPVIGFAGLTHLGLNSAVASAARGFDVIGYHDDAELVRQLKTGVPHLTEPQLAELMRENLERLSFTASSEDLAGCDIVYVAVDVPTDDEGGSDLTPVHMMINIATAAMNTEALLVILCQVPPGFTRQVTWPAARLIYQVETLVFGRAIERAIHPERFIIGVAEPTSALPDMLVAYLGPFGCPLLPMRYESAELAKIAINVFLVSTVTTVNTLAEICEHLDADWLEIVPALRLDKRIGAYAYLNAGLGIAGGNLERDLRTLMDLSDSLGTDSGTVRAWLENSARRKKWVFNKVQELVLFGQRSPVLALWGLTYKENTHSIKNSAAIDVIIRLPHATINAYDPAAPQQLPVSNVNRMVTMSDALQNADALLVMTPWEEFRATSVSDLKARMRGRVVIDPYRLLDGEALRKNGFKYVCIGLKMPIEQGISN